MATGWVWHERYAWHDTGRAAGYFSGPELQPFTHFESAESKARLASLVQVSGMIEHLTPLTPVSASEADLLRVHSSEHVARMREANDDPRGGDMGDGISPFARGGYDIARLAAGGTIAAVSAVMNDVVDNAYSLVRPPGHHARPSTGMGFCMFANIAIAIEYARAHLGVTRVAVLDWDVHHGNGTEEIFADDPDVLTVSIHQDRLYPADSGLLTDRGTGEGYGSVINIPLPAGSGNEAYVRTVTDVAVPAIEKFQPQLIIVACGFDPGMTDPLGRMMVTSGGFAAMTSEVLDVADRVCGGRVVINHEGGYSPTAVPFNGLAVIEKLSGTQTGVVDPYEAVWAPLPTQAATPAQLEVIATAAELVADIPGPPSARNGDRR